MMARGREPMQPHEADLLAGVRRPGRRVVRATHGPGATPSSCTSSPNASGSPVISTTR